jgi:hypothetical protein
MAEGEAVHRGVVERRLVDGRHQILGEHPTMGSRQRYTLDRHGPGGGDADAAGLKLTRE